MKFLKKNIPFFLTAAIIIYSWFYTSRDIYELFYTKDFNKCYILGFPLIFDGMGCIVFNYQYLLFDIAFLIILPFAIQLLTQKISAICEKKNIKLKKHIIFLVALYFLILCYLARPYYLSTSSRNLLFTDVLFAIELILTSLAIQKIWQLIIKSPIRPIRIKEYIPFLVTFAVILILWHKSDESTHNFPALDRNASLGFPLIYNKYGGFCEECDMKSRSFFNYINFLFDILFAITLPFVIQFIVQKNRSIFIKKTVSKL